MSDASFAYDQSNILLQNNAPPCMEIKAGIVSRSGNKPGFTSFVHLRLVIHAWNSGPDAFLNLKLFNIVEG